MIGKEELKIERNPYEIRTKKLKIARNPYEIRTKKLKIARNPYKNPYLGVIRTENPYEHENPYLYGYIRMSGNTACFAFCVLFFTFCISQHFVPGSVFA